MTAVLKPFVQMTPDDYDAIGLRCGLEIHQQILTKRKLFCRCPAGHYGNDYDAVILRHMRPTLSELGEYDGTALMEKKTKKNIFYRIHQDTVCTYEMDDTPPFFMDEEALDIALEVALLLRLNMVDELHIARKQYLDGSIPTGFQRTTIVGVEGWIPYKDRKIRIAQLGLEEDACREVSDVGHDRVYLTDRLGMPLIEPVTYPDMKTPQETAEVAEILRRITRSTGKVRTGYGAGRQDVNVSVAGGTRIEIKGVAKISTIPLLVYNEALRQCALLQIRDHLAKRGVTSETFAASHHDATRLLANAEYVPLQNALSEGHRVRCTVLKKFARILSTTTQTDTVFAQEFSDRVRVIACLTTTPNIAHSDSASESLRGGGWQKLRKRFKAGPDDALVLVWGSEDDVRCACEEIIIRAREATAGIPSDTRQALKDGTNGFERILPGAERMYPDTDLPPMAIARERLDRISAHLPQFVWDREVRYKALGLSDELACPLSFSSRANLFDRLTDELGIAPTLAGVVIVQRLKAFKRRGLDTDRLTDDEIYALFKAHAEGRLAREGINIVLRHILEKGETADEALDRLGLVSMEEERVCELVMKMNAQPDDGNGIDSKATSVRHMMGRLMADLLGRFDGRRLAAIVEEKIGGEVKS